MDWEKLGSRITRRGKKVTGRVREAADVISLRQKKASAEAKLYDAYADVGRQYFLEYEGEDLTPEMQAIFSRIEGLEADIAEYEKTILVRRGVKACPECGAEMELAAYFCSHCGSPLPVEEPEEEEEGEEELTCDPVCEEEAETGEACEAAEDVCEAVQEAAEEVCGAAEDACEAVKEAVEEVCEAAEEAEPAE